MKALDFPVAFSLMMALVVLGTSLTALANWGYLSIIFKLTFVLIPIGMILFYITLSC